MKNIYITTAIPYMNSDPHVGHAMDYCLADVCARYNQMIGNNVRLQAGTDEHGGKIFKKAEESGMPVQQYVTEKAEKLKDFIDLLGVKYTDFVRTTDEGHIRRCQEVWKKLSSHIYKAKYEGWYCLGCERFVTDKEYADNHGICPDHQKSYDKLAEENYYFRISDFKEQIRRAIESGEMLILPDFRKKEMLKLLDESPDVSVSRSVEQLTWGVPVPGDESQVMYVWIDALSNYITVLGYPETSIDEWWPAEAQFVGKDILRFHSIIWPAMLIGLGLPLPKTLVSHGMVLADGQKMSKTIGNVINPMDVLARHGQDAFRYYFLRHVDTFSDSDFTWEKFEDAYNNELANDLGNLVQRLATLANKNSFEFSSEVEFQIPEEYTRLMSGFKYSEAMDYVWGILQGLNRKIDEEKPWSLAKNGETQKLNQCLEELIRKLLLANKLLSPFLPEATAKITAVFAGAIVPPEVPLFPKK